MSDVAHTEAEAPQAEMQAPLSVHDAAQMLDIDALEGAQPRSENGQFKARESDQVQEAEATEVKADDVKPAEVEEPEQADETPEDDFDYIEMDATEEGAEPERIKVDDALAAYRERDDLKQQLEQAKQAQPTPVDWDKQAVEHVQAMQQLDDVIQQWQFANPINDPDPAMALEDPEQYYALVQQANQLRQNHAQAQQAREHAQREAKQRQDQLDNVMWEREKAKIYENWPEMQQQGYALEVYKDVEAHYGIKPEVLEDVRTAQAWSVIKDALAHRKAQGQQKAVVKAVKSKPRLVKAKARDGTNSKQRAQSQAQNRLAQTGSIADAADALKAFLD